MILCEKCKEWVFGDTKTHYEVIQNKLIKIEICPKCGVEQRTNLGEMP